MEDFKNRENLYFYKIKTRKKFEYNTAPKVQK